MRNYAYEEISKTEDGKYVGYCKFPYMTDYQTISVFADTKKELLEEQKYLIKAKSIEEWEM